MSRIDKSSSKEMECFSGIFLAETFKGEIDKGAILFVPDDRIKFHKGKDGMSWDEEDDAVWLPKSQILFDEKEYKRKDPISIEVPLWLAEKNKLI